MFILINTNLFCLKGPSLTAAHVLGLAVFVVHLHASMSDDTLFQLVPPVHSQPVPLAEALSSALLCDTRTNMLFSLRLDFILLPFVDDVSSAESQMRFKLAHFPCYLGCVWQRCVMEFVKETRYLKSKRSTSPTVFIKRYIFLSLSKHKALFLFCFYF